MAFEVNMTKPNHSLARAVVTAATFCVLGSGCPLPDSPCQTIDDCDVETDYCDTATGTCRPLSGLTAATLSLAPTSATVTEGRTVQFTATVDPAGTPVEWSVQQEGGGNVDANGLYTAPATPGTYTVLARTRSATPRAESATVVVVPFPAAPAINAPGAVTALKPDVEASVTAVDGIHYEWSAVNATITSGDGTPQIVLTAGSVGTMELSVVASNAAGDTAAPVTVIIDVVEPAVTPVITAPAAITTTRSASASVPAVEGMTFAWAVTGGTLDSGAASETVQFTAGAVGTLDLSVVQTNRAGDPAPAATASIPIVPIPETPAITAPAFVTAQTAGLVATVPAASGLTYAWTIANATITAGADTDTLTFTAGDAGEIVLGVTVGNLAGETSAPAEARITAVAPANTPTIVPAATELAEGASSSASITPEADTTYTWSIAGGTFTSATTASAVDFTAGSGPEVTLTVVAMNRAGDPAAPANAVITVIRTPPAPAITTSARVTTTRSGLVASIAPLFNGETVLWSITGGTITSADDGVTVTYTAGAPGTLELSAVITNQLAVSGPPGAASVEVVAAGLELVAGGAGGAGSADGVAMDARHSSPRSVVEDSAGSLFVADTGNHVIRKISVGDVTVFAGQPGVFGSDDGLGTLARFQAPTGLAIDDSDNLYVADTGNHTVRKITPAGDVSTWAGTAGQPGTTDETGAAARFNAPRGLVADAAGNVYVADTENHAIRRITSGRVVTTLAGEIGVAGTNDNGTGTNAHFNRPEGLTLRNTNLYVADTGNHTLREVSLNGSFATGLLSGRAGQPAHVNGNANATRFSFPRGITTDGSALYVADSGNHVVRSVAFGGSSSDLAGSVEGSSDGTGMSASFSWPSGVFVRAAGTTIHVADTVNHTVRAVTTAGVVTTVSGQAARRGNADGAAADARFSGPDGIALAPDGTAYIADTDNHLIRRISPTGEVTTMAGVAGVPGLLNSGALSQFSSPRGLALDGNGVLYVADSGNHVVRAIDAAGVVSTFAGLGTVGSGDGAADAATFNGPARLCVDGARLYVADTGNFTVRFVEGGTVSTLAGSAGNPGALDAQGTAALFRTPMGMALDGAGNLVIVDRDAHAVRQIAPDGTVTTVAGVLDAPGSADGPGAAAAFNAPRDIVRANGGTFFVLDAGSGLVRRMAANFDVTTAAGTRGTRRAGAGALPGSVNTPSAGALTPEMDLMFVDTAENVVTLLRAPEP